MTKSTITRERLEKIKSWRDTYGAGINVMLPAEEAAELASIALAAMDSEPVVPDEITSASAPEVFEISAEAERLGLRGTYASYAVGWNACRAAMLLAQSLHAVKTAPALGSLPKTGEVLYTNSPVIPDGYVMVPKVPTEDMIVAGFESEPDEAFSEPEIWEEYQNMSGCQQAAHRARLCWAAMLAAIPPAPKN